MAASFGLDDDVMREALGLRRRSAVSYTKEQVIPEDPAPARRKKSSSRGGVRVKEGSSSKAPRRRARADSDDGSESSEGSDDDDSDDDFCGNRSRRGGGTGRKKQAQRRSERSFLAHESSSRSVYKEASTDGSDDDSDRDVKRRRKAGARDAQPAITAPQSVIEKLLAQREVEHADAGDAADMELEYLAKLRSKSYIHCRWVSEAEVLAEHQGLARVRRWQKVWAALQEEFQYDAVKGAEWEPYPPEYEQVERVIATRCFAPGEVEYLVKWRMLTYADCTWEAAEDVADDEALAEFERTKRLPTNPLYRAPLTSGRKPQAQWAKQEASPVYRGGNMLRPYQLEGLNWMSLNWNLGHNSILADEMGLGKTVQTVSLLHYLHQTQGVWGPFLVIAPLSTLGHWQREFQSWTELNTIVYHGNAAARQAILEHEWWFDEPIVSGRKSHQLHKFNVLLTTYEMVNLPYAAGEPHLASTHWKAMVVDEAHRLKNADSKLTKELEGFSVDHLLLLTGTPLQNNASELFTLLHFLQPNEFPSEEACKDSFGELTTGKLVEKLHQRMRPYFLRRMKADVEKSVPPKEETIVEVELTAIQKQWYRAIYERNLTFLAGAQRAGNSNAHAPSLMNVMMEIRKCCNHPFLIKGAEAQILSGAGVHVTDSGDAVGGRVGEVLVSSAGKMVLVHKLLPKLRKQGRKVLIFSQMAMVLNILEDYLRWQSYPFERIDGMVKGNDRQAAIDRFSRPDSDRFVFLLCTKAGGVGINLTAADTVIIYDSDWNPQNDLQAQARCHRIGQTKAVQVYRLVTRNSYEEVMFEKASLKLGLDQAVLSGIESAGSKKLTGKEISALLRHGAYGALQTSDASSQFCEEDIDEILQRSSKVVKHTSAAAEAGSSFAKAHFAVSVGGTDVSVDDPEFWTKVGFANKQEDAHSKPTLALGERKRKQVARLGMNNESDEDEDASDAAAAERMISMMLRYGLHRAQDLPLLCRMPHYTAADALALVCGFTYLCTGQVVGSDVWPVCRLAASTLQSERLNLPATLQLPKIRERIASRAKDDLLRLNQLHALHVAIDMACAKFAGPVQGFGRNVFEASHALIDTLVHSTNAEKAADWDASPIGVAVTSLQECLSNIKGSIPAGGWGRTHDGRLLVGIYAHGWAAYDAIRLQKALWAHAPPLSDDDAGEAVGDASLSSGHGEGSSSQATTSTAPYWPENKLLERRLKQLLKKVPGAAPPATGNDQNSAAKSSAPAGDKGASDRQLPGAATTEGSSSSARVATAAPKADSKRSVPEDEEWAPIALAKKKGAAGAAPSTSGGGKAGGARVESESGGKSSTTRVPDVRKELQELLLAFGFPDSQEGWEQLVPRASSALSAGGVVAFRRAAENMRKEWEMDSRSKVSETARVATQRLMRLDVLSALRRYLLMSSAPSLPPGSNEGDAALPRWWVSGTHDTALVRGVLRHGFGNWKDVYGDKGLFNLDAAKSSPPSKMASLKRLKAIRDACTPKAAAPASKAGLKRPVLPAALRVPQAPPPKLPKTDLKPEPKPKVKADPKRPEGITAASTSGDSGSKLPNPPVAASTSTGGDDDHDGVPLSSRLKS